MTEAKKLKTIKKVTEIPNATVTIEVEERADESASTTTEIESTNDAPETENQTETEPETETIDASEKETLKQEPSIIITDPIESTNDSSGFGWKKVFLTILIVVPVGFLMFGGFLYFSKNLDINNLVKKEPKKTINLPSNSPAPTKEDIDKEAYVIEVQNGSGIAGEGARVKDTLESAGFKIVTVENADNSDYTDTIIKVASEIKPAYITELTEELEKRGSVGKTEKLAVGEDGQVIVILGSNIKEVSPSPTP